MDSRIQEKIDLLKQKKQEEAEEEARLAEKRCLANQQYIENKLPEARKWVQENLFDMIAQKTVNDKVNTIALTYKLFEPVEALVKAVAEIDGLKIISIYVPEFHGHINSDEVMETIPAHYDYYANWT